LVRTLIIEGNAATSLFMNINSDIRSNHYILYRISRVRNSGIDSNKVRAIYRINFLTSLIDIS